jgi:hypothetical protein
MTKMQVLLVEGKGALILYLLVFFFTKGKASSNSQDSNFQMLEHLLGVSNFVLLHIEGLGFVMGSTFYVMPLQ